MKRIFSLLLMATAIFSMLSCKTAKASLSVAEKSETVASEANRLAASLTTDQVHEWLTMSVDSMIMVLTDQQVLLMPVSSKNTLAYNLQGLTPIDADEATAAIDDVFFLSGKPPASKSKGYLADSKRTTANLPKALKIYGLHVDAGSQVKSNKQSLAKDSTAETAQSSEAKAKEVRTTAPSQTPMYIFYILLLAFAIFIIIKIHKWWIGK